MTRNQRDLRDVVHAVRQWNGIAQLSTHRAIHNLGTLWLLSPTPLWHGGGKGGSMCIPSAINLQSNGPRKIWHWPEVVARRSRSTPPTWSCEQRSKPCESSAAGVPMAPFSFASITAPLSMILIRAVQQVCPCNPCYETSACFVCISPYMFPPNISPPLATPLHECSRGRLDPVRVQTIAGPAD